MTRPPFIYRGLPASGSVVTIPAAAIAIARAITLAAHGTLDVVLLCFGSQFSLGFTDIFGQGPGSFGIRVRSCHQCIQFRPVCTQGCPKRLGIFVKGVQVFLIHCGLVIKLFSISAHACT